MTIEQDLQTLYRASEMALLSGPDRDAVRAAAQRLAEALKPKAAEEKSD